MASNSPSPSVVPSPTNSTPTPSLPPPPSISSASPSPPPSSSFSPPPLPTQPNANPPVTSTTPAPSSPPSQSDTSTTPTPSSPPSLSPPPSAPPPSQSRSPPPMASTSPTASPQPPSSSSGPPPSQPASPPPTPSSIPPTSPPSPPASSPPPTNSPPPVNPPPPSPPQSSSPPPASSSPPPQNSPPPVQNSPPPASSVPPQNSPPPSPSSVPPANSPPPATPADPPTNSSSPPPPSVQPPRSSPPPRSTQPGNSPPPTPPIAPPRNSSTPPTMTPPSQPTPPSPTTPGISPPSPVIRFAPPPPSSTDPAAPESSISPDNQGIGTVAIIAIAAVVGIVVLSLLGLAVWCVRKRRKDTSGLNVGYVMPSPLGYPSGSDLTAIKVHSTAPLIGSGSSSDFVYTPTEGGGLGNSRSWFTYEELVKATNGFSAMNLLGEGGFGSVYKGFLPDERVVAVKRLNIGGGQGEREFKAEVEIISRIHHRHLVSLVGYCISEDRRLLVYDYVPNNSLHFHLHGEGRPVLNWAMRVKIAAGAARGIAYLHEDCHPRIIHRDIKSSNILLDDNFEAKVSDFGLAKLALDANTHVTTRVMGTFGYMAPEYASSGKLTEKSDVFSYGVVLLELITGRKPVDASQPLGDESLVEWARPLLSHALENGEFGGLADPWLEKNNDENEMFRMIEVAAACVRHSAAKRPRMGQVVRAFDSLATADLTNGMRLGESEVYNAADQSAQIRWFRRMAFGSQNFSTDFFSQGSSSS